MTTPDMNYEPATFAALSGWDQDDHAAAFDAFLGSAQAVISNSQSPLALVIVALRALADASRIRASQEARLFFEANFQPFHVIHDGASGLLTGYYEPVLDGSSLPTPTFAVPLYRRPNNLENVVAESDRGATREVFTHVKRTASGTTPYDTREQIENGALADQGLELCYLADPVETFFLHIQGSGAIRLADGQLMRITYDGKNGHPYTSIGRTLIDDGTFAPGELTLQILGDWLRADLDRARRVMWRNESFVFFRELHGDHPIGVLGTPLHVGRSMAVDTAFHMLGMPIYVSAPSMTHVAPEGFNRLMIAHDVGSAIKGPERGDLFFGSGGAALALAGITKHHGHFHVLHPVAT
jgi:membrane-bound lytic murein transglycosylase A